MAFILPNGQPKMRNTTKELRGWLSENCSTPGSRLPPERALGKVLEVSRTEVRKSLSQLEADGCQSQSKKGASRGIKLVH